MSTKSNLVKFKTEAEAQVMATAFDGLPGEECPLRIIAMFTHADPVSVMKEARCTRRHCAWWIMTTTKPSDGAWKLNYGRCAIIGLADLKGIEQQIAGCRPL